MGPSTESLQPSAPPPPPPLSLLGLCFGLKPEQEEAVCAAFAAAGQEILPAALSGGEVDGALSPVVSGARVAVGVEATEAVAMEVAHSAADAEARAKAETRAAEQAPPFQSNFEAACYTARLAAEAKAVAVELARRSDAPRSLGLPR